MYPDVEHAPDTADLVDLLDVAAVGTAEAALVNDGGCVPLTAHLITWQADSPYVGYVMVRPSSDATDAAAAIAGIGALPATIRARELVVTWEHAELSTSLGLPGSPFPRAVAVLTATYDGHEVRWHPFDAQLGTTTQSGRLAVTPSWGRPWREHNAGLPQPIVELLGHWRAGRDPRELRWVVAQLQSEGYTVHWMKKASPECGAEGCGAAQ